MTNPTWTTTTTTTGVTTTFCELGQGVTIAAHKADANTGAFLQISYRGEVAHDTVDVEIEHLQAVAAGFGEAFFLGLAKKCREAK